MPLVARQWQLLLCCLAYMLLRRAREYLRSDHNRRVVGKQLDDSIGSTFASVNPDEGMADTIVQLFRLPDYGLIAIVRNCSILSGQS